MSEPVFSPEGGTFSGNSVSVRITCATAGASIRYKTGSTPPTPTSGTLIASGGTVSISTSANGTILQAIAYKSGMSNSPVHMDVYYRQGGGQQMMGGGMAMSMAMPPSRSETFVYDQLGNRKGVNVLDGRGNVTFARRDTGLNQYTSWTPPMAATNYDTNGVLTSEGWISGTYNALNQPITISSAGASVSFGYDPLGRCVKRVTSGAGAGTLFLYYDGWNLIQEGSSATSVNRIYVHGNRVDEIVADQTGGGVWSYHHYDARGHCILLTDASGNLVEQYSYDAFGKVYYYDGAGNALTDSARGNRFLFTGREWLSSLRLYDFRNRQYLPELGRFIQPDPIQFKAGDYNLYRYCHNDPVNKSDPTGLFLIMNMYYSSGLEGPGREGSQALLASRAQAQAGEPVGNGSGGSTTPIARTPEGAKANEGAARARVVHDESFELTGNRDIRVLGQKALAKTERHLEEMVDGKIGSDGKIDVTLRVVSKTTFPVGLSQADVMREWRRVEDLRQTVAKMDSDARWRARSGFRDVGEAKTVLWQQAQGTWDAYLKRSSFMFEIIGGGR